LCRSIAHARSRMQRLFTVLALFVTLALTLAIPPVAANAHCLETSQAGAVSPMSHDNAAMGHHTDHADKSKTDKKAADCLLRCLATCAGMTASAPSDRIVIAFVPLRAHLPASTSGEGLPTRPLLPPPQSAFI
jgi:hypothetical protein